VFAGSAKILPTDRLAARNALVLPGAGGCRRKQYHNRRDGGIAGAILAPDPMLATLPISFHGGRHVMARCRSGCWPGLWPPLCTAIGSAFGALSGVISCMAMLSGSFCSCSSHAVRGFYAAAHQSYRLPPPIRRACISAPRRCPGFSPAASLPRCFGTQSSFSPKMPGRPICRGTIWRNRRAPFRRGSLTLLRLPRPAAAVHIFADGRPLAEFNLPTALYSSPWACGLASYAMMNLMMTSAPLAMVMVTTSVGDAALGIHGT